MLGISEVIDNLYISGLETRQAILNKGIRSVINISSECPVQDLGPTVEYEKVSILDLPTTSILPYFDRLADRINDNLQQEKKTLVHWYVGRSRSASIILGRIKFVRDNKNICFSISLSDEIPANVITRSIPLFTFSSTYHRTEFWFY